MSDVATTTGGALAMPNVAALQAAAYAKEDMAGLFGTRTAFLPRLQLMTSNSDPVKEGRFPLAHYAVVKGKEDLTNAGQVVLVIPLAWRAKAMFVKVDPPVSYHKQSSPEFQDIKNKADADPNSGNLYGPEFLIWMPPYGYLTFFFANKSARNEAPNLHALLPGIDGSLKVASVSAQFIKNDQYKWHSPKVVASDQSLESPPTETLELTIKDFLSPRDSIPAQKAPEGAVQADR